MEKDSNKEKLFKDFPPASRKDWEKTVLKGLKGADFEKKLVYRPIEGFKVEPYYTAEDTSELDYLDQYPAIYPYIRGTGETGNNWFVRQDIVVSDLKRANEKALNILMKGIDSLGFILDEKKDYSKDDLDLLLRNIFAEMVEINFKCGRNSLQLMENHYEMLVRYNRDFQKIHGSVEFDPFGHLITYGNYYFSREKDLETCAELIKTAAHLPHFTVIRVSGEVFHNAGANIIEELAFSLASGTEYLTRLTENGLSVSNVAPKLRFGFAAGYNYFMEIAKYRAARLLWAHIVKAFGPSNDEVAKMNVHAVTSIWNKTLYDPHVNLLRTTTEAMSSIIGGIDSLTVRCFDLGTGNSTDFSERLSRNQQLLLKEESYLDRVIDPAAGSYYMENLTDSIATEAWKLFLEVDAQGGFIEAVDSGFIQERIRETSRKRDENLASRKHTILGVNQYPNFNESKAGDIPSFFLMEEDLTEEGAIVETIKTYRASQPFEKLRYLTDTYARDHKRPSAFMFTYGNLAMRIARSQFSRNFFACAGFETIDNLGFKTIEEGVKAFLNSKAEILVLCSSDEEYAELAPAVSQLVKDKAIVVVAGYPKSIVEELRKKGIEHFIHVKSNVLEELSKFQTLLGM
jgi:methylmalonyl-CoA mutase